MEGESVKLYIQCPNIVASMYAQKKLKEVFGFQILASEPHFSDRFLVMTAPQYCPYGFSKKTYFERKTHEENCRDCAKIKKDKPLILYIEPTMNQDGEISSKYLDKEWIPMIEALSLINLVNEKV